MGDANVAGYVVDPAGLESAIKKLKTAHDTTAQLVNEAERVSPGELTAGDTYTNQARTELQKRATGDHGSLRMVAVDLQKKLREKIDAYETVLAEYRANDENAAAEHRKMAL